jgi:hypothetical protein
MARRLGSPLGSIQVLSDRILQMENIFPGFITRERL